MISELGPTIRAAREAKGFKKVELARRLDISPSAISQWESGTTAPTLYNLRRLAELLEFDLKDLEVGYIIGGSFPSRSNYLSDIPVPEKIQLGIMPPRSTPQENSIRPSPSAPPLSSLQGLARDVPVRGIAVGGEDADFQMNGQDNDWAVRPPGLLGVRGLFALVVSNESMYPAWRPNATFYINPNRAPQIGDDVVVEMLPDETGEPGKAFLKRLKARTPTKIIVEQFNPPCDIEFDRDAVRLHRVVPWEEALGIS